MSEEELPPAPPPLNRFAVWFKGAFITNFCGAICLGMMAWVASGAGSGRTLGNGGRLSVLVSSTFLALPFAIGFGCAFFWQPAKLNANARFGWAFCNLLISLVGAGVILREGAICLAMASPLLLLLMWVGGEVGHHFWARNTFLSASLLPLLALYAVFDVSQPHSYAGVATTEVHSSLPPQKLWPFVANYPRNDTPPDWWLWQIGLPYPVQATGKAELGGRRDCQFSGGVSVGERVVAVVPNRRLEFVVDKQPNHPEILHHFELQRGRIELLPDGKGGTILSGTSWYALHVYPSWYFGRWCDAVVHHVHERVFAHMERVAR